MLYGQPSLQGAGEGCADPTTLSLQHPTCFWFDLESHVAEALQTVEPWTSVSAAGTSRYMSTARPLAVGLPMNNSREAAPGSWNEPLCRGAGCCHTCFSLQMIKLAFWIYLICGFILSLSLRDKCSFDFWCAGNKTKRQGGGGRRENK